MSSDIAIYSRKSKFTGKGESIENQIIKCKKFIEFKFNSDPEDASIFIDEDFTGRNENRPRFKEMIEKIKTGEIKHIIIYQLNRFGRNARDIHNSMAMCEEHNCVMYSATEGFDTSTSFGRAVMGILASLAQLETEQLGERIRDNMYTLAKMGRWLGGQSPLGFDGTRKYYLDESGKERSVTELKRNEEELTLVKSIYKRYIKEKSLSQVSKWALSNNFKGKNGGDFDKSAINSILQNPVYVKSNEEVMEYLSKRGFEVCGEPNGNGMLRYGKKDETIVAVSKHKGIIDADVWLEIQQILKKNTEKAPRMGKTNTALLTGILKCSCGSPMRVTYGHTTSDGIKPFYYTCVMKNNSGGARCQSKNINGLLLEEKLIKYLKSYNSNSLISQLEESFKNTNEIESEINTKRIEIEIEKCNKSISQLISKLKLIQDDEVTKIIINEITFEKNKIKELTSKKEEILNDQSELAFAQSDVIGIVNTLEEFNRTFDSLTLIQKQNMLKILLEKIIYTNDKFKITFNIKKKLDNVQCTLSSVITKYKLSQFRVPCFCSLSQIAIDENELMYNDLPENTFAERFKKAKMLKGLTQEELSKVTGLSRATINELEADYRDTVTIETLNKLLTVLDKDILCDDYYLYILNQKENMKNLLSKYGITELSNLLKSHHSTIYRWVHGQYQITRNKYELIKNLDQGK